MSEFSNKGTENLMAPERLTADEVHKVLELINDERLFANEDVEHFTIHLGGRIVNIPKRSIIHIEDRSGVISKVNIADYIQQVIDEYDNKE